MADPNPYAEPIRLAALMSGFDRPWFVAGGWAIDLFLGRIRRHHKDVDFTIFRRDQLALQQHLSGLDLKKIVDTEDSGYPETWSEGEWLELPNFQIWIELGADGWPTLETVISETDGDEWWWRKNPQVRRPLALFGKMSPLGVPYLSPEIVLLHKSRHVLNSEPPKHDQEDFEETVDMLDPEARMWLKATLETYFPGHPWIERLSSLTG